MSDYLPSISNQRLSRQLEQLTDRVSLLKHEAMPEFEALVKTQKIIGAWEDKAWQYLGARIYFSRPIDKSGEKVTSKTPISQKVSFEKLWGDIYRLYILSKIKTHKSGAKRTIPALMSHVSWLAEICNCNPMFLLTVNQDKLDALIPLLQQHYTSKRGVFERYKSIISFLKQFVKKKRLGCRFTPKNNMDNPALKVIDASSGEAIKASEEKFDENIDKYLGMVRQRFELDKKAIAEGGTAKHPEPKPGYDELRLLATPFFLAMGIRIGELVRLTDDCLDYDEVNEKHYLKVLTEKGELAAARPVPREWEDVIVKSFNRILEITSPFREFARDVEKRGEQAFIDILSFPDREEEFSKSLAKHGYDPDLHFVATEIGPRGSSHPCGLTVNSLNKNKIRSSKYSAAKVGEIRTKVKKTSRQVQTHKVFSKVKIAAIAMEYYTHYKKIVYHQNFGEGDNSTQIISSSYSVSVPFSKLLFLVNDNFFHSAISGAGMVPYPMTAHHYSRWLTNGSSRATSVFERYGILDDSNEPVRITSKQFRHWLTTALLRAGKNLSIIDLWMGRKAGQGRNYDHRTAKERAESIRTKYLSDTPPNDVLGRRIKRMRDRNVSLDEILSVLNHTLSAVHYTPWGTCDRALDISPCEKGMMCLRGEDGQGCRHFGLDVTDMEAKVHIENTKVHYEKQLQVLLPNYQEISETLNKQEPLDQHVQFCIDTLNGCINALKAYENADKYKEQEISVVNIFKPLEKS
ncbi:hypothetical protein ACPV5R_11125 [Vibrio astriarenae]